MRKIVLAALAALLLTGTAYAARTDLTIGIQLEPTNLDPTTGGAAAAIRTVTDLNIYNGLTRIDKDGAVQPDLATSWDISPDGLTYTFHLKTGVKFNDGTPFTADDVKWTLDRDRAADSKSAQKQLFANIKQVDVVDPATVKVTLTQPQGDFLYDMGWGDAVIVSQKTAETNVTNPVGTGPYQLGEWVKADHITLVPNPNYTGTKPALDKVTFKFISDPTAAASAVLAGDVDVFSGFPAPELLEQFKANPDLVVTVGSTQGETIAAMNNAHPPLDNVKVREAIAHAIDRKAIIDGSQFGYGTPIGSFFPPGDPAYIDLTSISNFDPAKSKQLLADAGVKDLTLTFKVPPAAYARAAAPIIQQELADVGIKVNVVNVEWADWIANVFQGAYDYDLTMVSHVEANDFAAFGKPGYYTNYKADGLNKLVAELNATTDPAKQISIKQDIQKLLANDFVALYLFELPNITVAKKGVTGLWENAPQPTTDLSAISWTE
ncbi:MAG TPA: ABC transporter substrate-binding protein [Devosia sp.]|jgi:peptide/nickel transport system substrate-binding protein|nr:ABC transporter substrate-binding protein [Devosia sp.]